MKTLKGTCNDWKAECFAATLVIYLTCFPTNMPSAFAKLGPTPCSSLPLMNLVPWNYPPPKNVQLDTAIKFLK